MGTLLRAMAAVAFVAGGAGLLVLAGNRDRDTSWYPWPPPHLATKLLVLAAIAAATAFVTWVYLALI